MVFMWLRDSVLQCFCKSCKVASITDQKPHHMVIHGMVDKKKMPSKRLVFATEIRASEEKKGGLKYELVLADPAENPPPKIDNASPPKTPISVDDIQQKLKAAEERRQSMEAQRLNQLSEKLNKLQEVTQKKQETVETFREEVKKQHTQKMESSKENKDAIYKAMQEKLKEHEKRCSKVRDSLENQKKAIIENLNKKLSTASEIKDAQIQALQERLRLHDKRVSEVRQIYDEQMGQIKEKHDKKLQVAASNRDAIIEEIQQKMKQHEKRILQVRQTNQENVKDFENKYKEIIDKKLEEAETKRLSFHNSMKEKLVEHGRHIEEVRQNKMQAEQQSTDDVNASG